ncbi:sigma-54-dependent transcriptional regulator [Lacipirellula parvula]|uniref:Response regulator of zinc sigma-54-dependent two-component system n=1 Tax=Lacipirellula parvula TaxID=2650471 RepID=A0A5K7XBX9_9BACT|nr:sigma-54 dependent transcriptional regulator [Lacipirellula parvula]BBO34320.1 response regulator of zinc sigma-54-dependent two-component system [Lacipirellula parvula]
MHECPDFSECDLLLVDDDRELRGDMAQYFASKGYRVREAANGTDALVETERQSFDVAVIDFAMPEMTGIALLEQFKARGADMPVVMLTGEATVSLAVEAMKLGASEFLSKPISLRELERLVKKAAAAGRLRRENQQLKAVLRQQRSGAPQLVGGSSAMEEVFRLISRTAGSVRPILIQGESGTGKELVARALHEASGLADKPLVIINCAALPEALLESELFGHEKGAFTGAVAAKEGLFEVADGGTLFVDEIGELAASLQAKLLRVLEDGSLRRVGSVKERRVRVRLIAATNRDLAKEVQAGRFREDLFYRINVLTIALPALRDREGDIERLVRHFLGFEWKIEDPVLRLLTSYSWPGNVRQLINALERAKVLADDEWIRAENLPPEIVRSAHEQPLSVPGQSVGDLESVSRRHVEATYLRMQGNKSKTAKALGIGRRTLYRLLDKYGIEPLDQGVEPTGE